MKTNIEYYAHRKDAHRHPKFKMLRSIYGNGVAGWAAEGRFWALNNFIADAENCELDLSKVRNKGVIADELGLSIVEFNEFIDRLKSEEVELLIEVQPGIFSTEKVLEALKISLRERKKSRDRKSLPEELKSPDGKAKSSPEQNHRLDKTRLEETKEDKTKLQLEENDDSGSGSFETPNFEDKENLTATICELFSSKADNENPDPDADIKPVYDAIFDKRESMTPEICYYEIVESFLVMKRKQKTNTDFLLGIIRNKLNTRFAVLQESKTTVNQKESDRIRAQTAHEDYLANQKIIAENNKKLNDYHEFYTANKKLFTREERDDLKRYFDYGMVEKIELIILPKMQDITL
jgi:hypothetical protein